MPYLYNQHLGIIMNRSLVIKTQSIVLDYLMLTNPQNINTLKNASTNNMHSLKRYMKRIIQ